MLQNTEGRVYFWSPTTISKSSQKKKKRTSFCYVYVDGKKKKKSCFLFPKKETFYKGKNWQLVIGFNCTYFTRKLTYYEFAWITPCIQYFNTPKKPLFSGHYTFSAYPLQVSHAFLQNEAVNLEIFQPFQWSLQVSRGVSHQLLDAHCNNIGRRICLQLLFLVKHWIPCSVLTSQVFKPVDSWLSPTTLI